jgi:hypothetical protein
MAPRFNMCATPVDFTIDTFKRFWKDPARQRSRLNVDDEPGRLEAGFTEATEESYSAVRRLEILRIMGTKAEFEDALVFASEASELMEAAGLVRVACTELAVRKKSSDDAA